jgi:hypothetical protein
MGPATLPQGACRTAESGQGHQMAAMICITQRQTQQSPTPITQMQFGAMAGFKQCHTCQSLRIFFRATVRLHGFSLLRITLVVMTPIKRHFWLVKS